MISKDTILTSTNGGLDIIVRMYPDAEHAMASRNKKFKIRANEATPSASISNREGIYYVTDFGGDQKAKNAIDLWMDFHGLTFSEAILDIASSFGIADDGVRFSRQASFRKRKKTAEDTPGYKTYPKDKPTPEELSTLGNYVNEDAFQELRWLSLEKYEIIKDDKEMITVIESTDQYPIFEIVYDGFSKIYQPFSDKKEFRFMYIGERKKNYVCGLEQLKWAFNSEEAVHESKYSAEELDKMEPFKLDAVVICAGEKDALNVKAIGFNVLWMNSETDIMKYEIFQEISNIVENIYYCGDLDHTGKKMADKWALTFLPLKIIELPEYLKEKRDWRGKACKDVTDYLKYHKPSSFRNLLNTAYPYQFWEYKAQRKDGKVIGHKYQYNQAYALKFIERQGYCRHRIPNVKMGYIYIHIDGNIIRQVDAVDIKQFIIEFVKERRLNVQVMNLVYNTRYLSEAALSNLPLKELDFKKADGTYQYMFFEDIAWKITKTKLECLKLDEVNTYVWEDEVIRPQIKGGLKHRIKPTTPFFEVTGNDPQSLDIKILRQDHPFFQFLINTSRVHWRKEFDAAGEEYYQTNEEFAAKGLNKIDGDLLDEHQRYDQKMHLINKLHVLGYLLHTHKDPSRPWAVWAMDDRLSEQSESHGRSGKSITFDALRKLLKSEYENGRNAKLTEKSHLFENVTKHTDYLLIDDANLYIDLNFFYAWITGDMPINPKHNKSFSIPFSESPKLAFTSNYPPRNRDSSTMGRLYMSVYSDYYHGESNDHLGSRSPVDDLGLRLFDDFTVDQWNDFFNLMAQCLQLSMRINKVRPPMKNIEKRSLLIVMGDIFYNWANESYMPMVNTPGAHQLDWKYIPRTDFIESFQKYNPKAKGWSMKKFTQATEAWCKFHGFEFNPKDYQNSQGRIFKKDQDKKIECFMIWAPSVDALKLNETDNDNYEDLDFMKPDPETGF